MCEQVKNKYADGDIVWVKLRSYWWPGQVISIEKLPEDIRIEFKEKPLVAAVKFFQEDSFEFVKSYQQIYEYNCIQKDKFIKKGLGKYRIRSKDGSNYMDKFLEDVKMAETLTGGNPNILLSEKFNPTKKPDISRLFGDKKMLKKKHRDDVNKKISRELKKKVTYSRVLNKNDHDIRIRQQPENLLSNSNSNFFGTFYPCHICEFTSTRVNVIICHLKSHRLSSELSTKMKMNLHLKPKYVRTDFSKRKHVRKVISTKNKTDNSPINLGKRKYFKVSENSNKKKKSDPELREKLLADWNVDSDEDDINDLSLIQLRNNSTPITASNNEQSIESASFTISKSQSETNDSDSLDLLRESDQLLKETNNFVKFSSLSHNFKKPTTLSCSKLSKEDYSSKKSRLACFDFNEDDTFEPSTSSVKKMSRGYYVKSNDTFVKKKMIQECAVNETPKTNIENNFQNFESSIIQLKNTEMRENERRVCEGIKNDEYEKNEENNYKKIGNNKKNGGNFQTVEGMYETQVEILEIVEVEKQNEVKEENNIKSENFKYNNFSDKETGNRLKTNGFENIDIEKNVSTKTECQEINNQVNKTLDLKKKTEQKLSSDLEDACVNNNETQLYNLKNISRIHCPSTSSFLNSEISTFSYEKKDQKTIVSETITETNTNFNDESDDIPEKKINKDENAPKNEFLECSHDFHKNKESKLDHINVSDSEYETANLHTSDYKLLDSSTSSDNYCQKTDIEKKSSEYRKNNINIKLFDGDFHEKVLADRENHKINNVEKSTDISNNINKNKTFDQIHESKQYENKSSIMCDKEKEKYEEEKYLTSKECSLNNVSSIKTHITKDSIEGFINVSDKKFLLNISEASEILFEETVEKEVIINALPASSTSFTIKDEVTSPKSISNFEKQNEETESRNIETKYSETNKTSDKQLSIPTEDTSSSYKESIVSDLALESTSKKPKFSTSTYDINIRKKSDCLKNPENVEEFQMKQENSNLSPKNLNDVKTINIVNAKNKGNCLETCLSSENKFNRTNASNFDVRVSKNLEENSKVNENLEKSSILISRSEVTVPVKKREKPRIIENVTLKKPMILKTKLSDKHEKMNKYNPTNKFELIGARKTKTTKVGILFDKKIKSSFFNNSKNVDITQKKLKISNASLLSSKIEKTDQIIDILPQIMSDMNSEKYAQQNSDSLINMELDINSIPFVLSEDILTPESIEQMPVVISPVLPTSNSTSPIQSTSFITTSKELTIPSQSLGTTKEIHDGNVKKRSELPTILKNKSKGKPTITSIKTIVPPLAPTDYKRKSNISIQSLKASLNCPKSPGKYVIVQTSGHQQAYSTHQKTEITASKSSANAQIVQQGGKVVILTSPQSGKSKQSILPLKSLSHTINNKNVKKNSIIKQNYQVCTSSNVKNLFNTNSLLTLRNEKIEHLPQLSKSFDEKDFFQQQQQMVISKNLPVQIPKTKSSEMTNTINVFNKEEIQSQINTLTSKRKNLANFKPSIAKSFPLQNSNLSKNILIPITQSCSGKIISSQSIVSKGTILTPITGSQVKAIAAKSMKGNKSEQQSFKKAFFNEKKKNYKISINPSSLINSSSPSIKLEKNIDVLDSLELKTIRMNEKKELKNHNKTEISEKVLVTSMMEFQEMNPEKVIEKLKPVDVDNQFTIKSQESNIFESIRGNTNHPKSMKKNENLLFDSKDTEKNKLTETNADTEPNKDLNENSQEKITSRISLTSDIYSVPTTSKISESLKNKEIGTVDRQEIIGSNLQYADDCELEKIKELNSSTQTEIMGIPTENSDGTQTYVLVTVNDQGQIIPIGDNFDENKILYVDSSTFYESENTNNIVLQFENNTASNINLNDGKLTTDSIRTVENSSIENVQTANQDILAAALANTDFQHDINSTEPIVTAAMTSLTQTNLINQTILQSTIIPPTEPISSPLVLETSSTLNQPIMTPLEIPSSLSSQSDSIIIPCKTAKQNNVEFPILCTNKKTCLATNRGKTQQISCSSLTDEENNSQSSLLLKCNHKISHAQCTSNISPIHLKNKILKTKNKLLADITDSITDDTKGKIQLPSPDVIDSYSEPNCKKTSELDDNLKDFITKTSKNMMEDISNCSSIQGNEKKLYYNSVYTTESNLNQKVISKVNEVEVDPCDNVITSHPTTDFTDKVNEDNSNGTSKNIKDIQEEFIDNENLNYEMYIMASNSIDPTILSETAKTLSNAKVEDKSIFTTEESALLSKKSNYLLIENPTSVENSNIFSKNITALEVISDGQDKNLLLKKEKKSCGGLVSITNADEVNSDSSKSEKWHKIQSASLRITEADEKKSSRDNVSKSYKFEMSIDTPELINEKFEVITDVKVAKESLDKSNVSARICDMNTKKDSLMECRKMIEPNNHVERIALSSSENIDITDPTPTSIINSTFNEDETVSSSYVPETPENQERDQDQESAVSTSSYEIPPCDELHIVSSNTVADTATSCEHLSIHNNGVPDISSSSYTLNSDSTATAHSNHLQVSTYISEVNIEQNIPRSYEAAAVSMSNFVETAVHPNNFLSEETENEYYSHSTQVTVNYYDSTCQQSNPPEDLKNDFSQKTIENYIENHSEDTISESTQNYFTQEETTSSYNNCRTSSNFYNSHTETEMQSNYFSTQVDNNPTTDSVLENVEDTQTFFPNKASDQPLTEETTTSNFTDRYALGYLPDNSTLDRHSSIKKSESKESMNR